MQLTTRQQPRSGLAGWCSAHPGYAELRFHASALIAAWTVLLTCAQVCPAVPFEKEGEKVLAGSLDRPVVMVFGASWCGWCRKLESVTLTDESVEALAADFLWIHVDIDEQEEFAAQFGVRGVPATIVLNDRGAIIGNLSGYVPPERFVEFLTHTLESPQEAKVPIPAAIANFLESESGQEQLLELVTTLARPDRLGRPMILAAFQTKGLAAADGLLELLSHEHLAMRAAAAQALRQATGANLPFNAFASPEDREAQVQAWSQWLSENQGSSSS